MRVSVVIPNLNSPIIDRTLAAILGQAGVAGSDVEIVVVGRDGPGRVTRSADNVRFIDTGQPMPPAPARNRGVAESHGEIIVFTDADCVPAPDWLARLLAVFAAEPETAVVGGGVAFPEDNYWTLADNISSFYPYLSTTPAGEREQLPSLNLACRRGAWEAIGPFDERYPFPACEDSDWSTRARLAGYRLRFEPSAVVHHHPPRSSAAHLWRHALRFGRYSIKVDPRYWPHVGRPFVFRHPIFLAVSSPILAAAVTLRAFAGNRALWRHWRTAPAVYLAKIGWCVGAYDALVASGRRGAAGPPRPSGGRQAER